MEPLDQYRIDRGTEPPTEPPASRGSRAVWVVGIVALMLLIGTLAYFYWRPSEPPVSTQAEVPTPAPAAAPIEVAEEPVTVPPLGLTDPLVRELVAALSDRPELAAWLATDNLIRNFVVSVDNVADGVSPARHLRRVAPTGTFEARSDGESVTVDPQSYARYNGIADTVAALNPADLASIYSTLKPRLDEAYRELGYPDGNFDRAMEAAIVRLLRTPVPNGDLVLTEGVLSYRYADESLEVLSPAQKHLLRMGPRNMRLVHAQLRAIARELGIPAERLPAPPF